MRTPGPLSFIHHRMPTTLTAPSSHCPLPPTTAHCAPTLSEEDRSSALEGGHCPLPHSKEDLDCARRPARARRSARARRWTSVTTTSAPVLGRVALTLGDHWPTHMAVVGLSSPTASRAACYCHSVTTIAQSSGRHPPT
jgi:hypothetical protein